MKLIVNIPAFNEEESIGKTIHHIKESFQADFYVSQEGNVISQKLIQVVDDGSTDQTVQVAKEAGADIIISYRPNRRLAYSFKQAVESALKHQADLMVNIDADGQFNPDDIPQLLQPILREQADMTIASRFGTYRPENMPPIKYLLNKFISRLIGFFLSYPVDDLTCGFRAHNQETLLRLNLTNTHFTYTQETIIDAIDKNLKLRWIPVKVKYFSDRQSRIVSSVWQFVNNSAAIILRAVRDVRPLKFFGWPGLIFLLVGLTGAGFFLYHYIQTLKIRPYLNCIIFSSVFVLLGIQLLIFALIADMIKSSRKINEEMLYQQRKQRFRLNRSDNLQHQE